MACNIIGNFSLELYTKIRDNVSGALKFHLSVLSSSVRVNCCAFQIVLGKRSEYFSSSFNISCLQFIGKKGVNKLFTASKVF